MTILQNNSSVEVAFDHGDSSQRVLPTGPDGSQSSLKKILPSDVRIRVTEIGRDRLQFEAGTPASVSDDDVVRWLKDSPVRAPKRSSDSDPELVIVANAEAVAIKGKIGMILLDNVRNSLTALFVRSPTSLAKIGALTAEDGAAILLVQFLPELTKTTEQIARATAGETVEEEDFPVQILAYLFSCRAAELLGIPPPENPKAA